MGAVQRQRRQQPERDRKPNACRGHHEAVQHGLPDRSIGEELRIPAERQVARRKAAYSRAIERIENQHRNRQIQEREHQPGVERQQRSATTRPRISPAIHLKDHRFSRRSVEKSSKRMMASMHTLMAAPSGQSYAAPKRLCTTFAIIVPEAPPTNSGARKSPSESTNANVAPAISPGMESGKITRAKVFPGPAPRSCDASASARGTFSRAA